MERTSELPVSLSRTRLLEALRSPWGVGAAAAAFWMGLIYAIHSTSPRTLISFHGMLHAAIAERFLGAGALAFPPENPVYAGHPVPYYWSFHLLGALWTRVSGWDVFYSLEAIILVATGAMMVAAVWLSQRVFKNKWTGVAMGYLVVAGTNPLGFVFGIWTALKIALTSPERIAAAATDQSTYLWNVVHPIYSLIRFNDYGGLYGPLLNFFLNMTSRPVALAALLGVVFCLHWALRGNRRAAYLGLVCASALTTGFNPLVGIGAGGALAVSLPAVVLWSHRKDRPLPGFKSLAGSLAAGLALGAGVLLAAPTYYHMLFGPSASQVQFSLFAGEGMSDLATVGLSIGLLVILAVAGLESAPGSQRIYLQTLLLAGLVLVFGNIAVTLPLSNDSNFFHAAVVLLAVPASGSILSRVPRAGWWSSAGHRTVALGLVFAPTTLMLLAAYVNRPALPARLDGALPSRTPETTALSALYEWTKAETEPNAVFVLDPRNRLTMVGNTVEFPAMTGRVIFTEQLEHYLVWPYPDAPRRLNMATELVSGQALSAEDRAYLTGLDRPVYIVVATGANSTAADALTRLYGEPVFRNEGYLVSRWRE